MTSSTRESSRLLTIRTIMGALVAASAACDAGALEVGTSDDAKEAFPGLDAPPGASVPRPTTLAACAGASGTVATMLADNPDNGSLGMRPHAPIGVDGTHLWFVWRVSNEQELLLRAPKDGGPVEEVRRGYVAALASSDAATFWVRHADARSAPLLESSHDASVQLAKGLATRVVPLSATSALVGMREDGAPGGGSIYRLAGAAPSQLERVLPVTGSFAYDGSKLFYLSDFEGDGFGSITYLRDDGDQVGMGTGPLVAGPLAVDAVSVYAVRRTLDDFVVRAFDKGVGTTSRPVHSNYAGYAAILADADAIYLAEPGLARGELAPPSSPPVDVRGGLVRVPRDASGTPVRVHDELRGPHTLASDAAAVYFAGPTGIRCYRK